ncbi:MAG: glutaredoxin [Methylophaga sp.]|nr:MAG: glutaredoxin [Methylophaga sp.]
MPNIEIYSMKNCVNCEKTKQLLDQKQLSYAEVFIEQDYRIAIDVVNRSGQRTVPQIFIDGVSIGGYKALSTMFGIN